MTLEAACSHSYSQLKLLAAARARLTARRDLAALHTATAAAAACHSRDGQRAWERLDNALRRASGA